MPLQQSLRHLQSAFRWRDGRLTLAKMAEPLDIRWSRPLPEGAEPSTVTVSRGPAGRWHVSILVETTVDHAPPTDRAVGVDAGITSLLTLSTGEKITNPRHERRDRERLARAQRALARKEKGSANRVKARLRVARAISDASWSEMRSMLEYKCDWYGRDLVGVDRWLPSSKTCSHCGHLLDTLPLRTRGWTCPGCGVSHYRDVNAARNILAAGQAVTACGAGVRPTRR